MPFKEKPPLTTFSEELKNRFQTNPSPQMDEEIKRMIEEGVIKEIQVKSGFLSALFLIPKPDGSFRPIFNLQNLNEFLLLQNFSLISHFKVPQFLQKGDFLLKIDISKAYFHIPIKENHYRFLCLTYRSKIFCMTCLPFGLASAPQLFASFTNWVASYFRKIGVRIIVYLDDFLIASQDRKLLIKQGQEIVNTLNFLGWKINLTKSQLHPQTQIEFLGITWDPTNDLKILPQAKQWKLKKSLQRILDLGRWDFHSAMSILGELNFAAFVVPLGRLHSRRMQRASRLLKEGFPLTNISQSVIQDLRWWLNAVQLATPIFSRNPQIFITADASDTGWGAHIGRVMIAESWSPEQVKWHINQKEMYAVSETIARNIKILENKSILVQSDNKSVIYYINKEGGTRSQTLLHQTEELLTLAHEKNVSITARYIPGVVNSIADSLSRKKPIPDWHLSTIILNKIFQLWGVPEIDLFATHRSAVVPRYAAQSLRDHQAEFVDAFSQEWNFNLAWVFPPPPLLPRVLQHLNSAQGVYIVVAPKWHQVFWRVDLKSRATRSPFRIYNLEAHLIDLETGLPPPQVNQLHLEAWRIRGGSVKFQTGK